MLFGGIRVFQGRDAWVSRCCDVKSARREVHHVSGLVAEEEVEALVRKDVYSRRWGQMRWFEAGLVAVGIHLRDGVVECQRNLLRCRRVFALLGVGVVLWWCLRM